MHLLLVTVFILVTCSFVFLLVFNTHVWGCFLFVQLICGLLICCYLCFICSGDLNLVMLPTSDLRLSFAGDDGKTETFCTLSCNSDCSTAVIEEIPADSSGRSFLVKCPDSSVYFFWCSEKSKLLGIEVLAKVYFLAFLVADISENIHLHKVMERNHAGLLI